MGRKPEVHVFPPPPPKSQKRLRASAHYVRFFGGGGLAESAFYGLLLCSGTFLRGGHFENCPYGQQYPPALAQIVLSPDIQSLGRRFIPFRARQVCPGCISLCALSSRLARHPKFFWVDFHFLRPCVCVSRLSPESFFPLGITMPAFSCCVVLHRDVRTMAVPEVHLLVLQLLLFRFLEKEVCSCNFASGTLVTATFLAGTFVTATSATGSKLFFGQKAGLRFTDCFVLQRDKFSSVAFRVASWLPVWRDIRNLTSGSICTFSTLVSAFSTFSLGRFSP